MLSQEDEEDVWRGDGPNGKWKSQSFASKKIEKILLIADWFCFVAAFGRNLQ